MEAVEKSIFVLKISSFKLSESFKSVAQSVREIFEEVYLGAQCAPPPLVGIGSREDLMMVKLSVETQEKLSVFSV